MTGTDSHPSGSQPGDEATGEGPGVLGNLPRSRPAVRSPRRATAVPKQPPEAESRASEPQEEQGEEPRGREAEVEALARAGVSLAGEAASLGLRFAGRAASALRDAVERS